MDIKSKISDADVKIVETQGESNNINGQMILKFAPSASLHLLDSVDSTNNYAKNLINAGAQSGTLVIAQNQIGGKGRLGRKFFSVDNSIFMSVVIRECSDFMLLTSAAAAAVHCAIKKICGLNTQIKWVNDIYLNKLKVCGILAEATTNAGGTISGAAVGIGVNLFHREFPDELNNVATALYQNPLAFNAANQNIPYLKEKLICEIFNRLNNYVLNIQSRDFLSVCRSNSIVLGKQITVTTPVSSFLARAVEIDDNGALIAAVGNKTVILNTGEISVKLSD